ncbi:long-chain fatty acid transporter [Aeromonas schubertii]|uniref:outer membrane protein transport protein n=1 Tax=Aeromonas schubertii TaxID=652 RepID=UPI00067F694F|nr:outer membrane protein transport protein [Aeromonas schubertii]KUE78974.1 long-chain fatty acid transporter [Aeromonas schubertii]
MTTASFKKSLLAAAVALASTQAYSAAFQLNEHSASGLGRAYAGEAAVADNASVLARNPAAMTMFDKMAVSVSGTYIHPDVDVNGQTDGDLTLPNGGKVPNFFDRNASESGIAPSAFVPAAYFIQPLKEDLAWGIAMFSNYGLSTEYPETFAAGSGAGNTELLTFNINPNLAYRVAPGFSLGAGINFVYAEAELNRYAGVLSSTKPQQMSRDTNISHMKGDDWGFGWNVGALYEFNQDNRLALTYRSQVNIKFKGDYKGLSTIGAGKPGQTVDGELNMELPAQAELAGYHRLNPQFAVHYSVNWTDWSAFQELKATSDSCVSADGAGVCLYKPEKFKDSMRYAIGGTWYINPSWEARIGFAYDNSPIEPEYRSLSIPDSDRIWYSAGATYHIDKDMSVDFGMAYLDGKEVEVNEGLVNHDGTVNNPRWKGTSHGNAFLASAQFNMKF